MSVCIIQVKMGVAGEEEREERDLEQKETD